MTAHSILFQHDSGEWYTQPEVYRALDAEFHFDFDPFPASNGGPPDFDGLTIPWKSRNYANPPYSIVAQALAKGTLESRRGNLTVFLIFARTETRAWHKHIIERENVEVRFVRGRLTFLSPGGKAGRATAPSAVVVMHPAGTVAPNRLAAWNPVSNDGSAQARLFEYGETAA